MPSELVLREHKHEESLAEPVLREATHEDFLAQMKQAMNENITEDTDTDAAGEGRRGDGRRGEGRLQELHTNNNDSSNPRHLMF